MEYITPEQTWKRPQSLLFLTILTFIGSGIMFITFLTFSLNMDMLPHSIEFLRDMGQPEEILQMAEKMMDIPVWKYLFLTFTYALAITGAAFMLKMKKIGFHIYIISQILLFCGRNLILGGDFGMSTLNIIISILFILLYGRYYKLMTSKEKEEENESLGF